MSQYKYDEEGGQFLTFVLTFLVLVLAPTTWSLISSSGPRKIKSQGWFDAKGQKVSAIKRLHRRSLLNPKITKKFVFVIVGWAAVAWLTRKVSSAATNSQHAIYDPFQILGIAASATEKEIKKHYKRLSVKFHPDKIRLSGNQTKEDVESHYIELTKAYKALTDETIRKNFELYGHPDGRQEMSMGIALPTWVVEGQNNIWVLGAYGVVFGILMPYFVARWWYGSRSLTKDGIIVGTAQKYFQHLREDTTATRIFALLSVSEEFEDVKLDKKGLAPKEEEALAKMEAEVKLRLKELGPNWAMPAQFRSASVRKAFVLFHAHHFRIETDSVSLTKDRYIYAGRAEKLLNGMLQIALAHNWLTLSTLLMTMIQCIVQAVPVPAGGSTATSELLQLAGLTPSRAKAIAESSDEGALGIQGLWNIDDSKRKELIGASELGEKQYQHITKVMGDWPRVELTDAYFKVAGERVVTTAAIVQLTIKARLLPLRKDGVVLRNGVRSGSPADVMEKEESNVKSGEDEEEGAPSSKAAAAAPDSGEGQQQIGAARAPHFVRERKPQWWILLGDAKQDRVIVQPTKMTDIGPDKERVFTMQFQAPPNAGLYTFLCQIKSDSYLGADANVYIKVKIEDAAEVESEEDDGDDISEPDEDSLAGQMALMRGGKVKPSPVHGHDDDDEEEEEELIDDDGPEDSDTDAE